MLARPETISMPPDVISMPAPIKKLIEEYERLITEYRASAQTLSDLDARRHLIEQRDAEDSAKALRAGRPVKEQAHLAAHIKAVGAARHLEASLATAADACARDLVKAVEKEKPTLIADADGGVKAAEQGYTKAVEALELAHRNLSAARSHAGWIQRFPGHHKAALPEAASVPLVGLNGSEHKMGDVLAALKSAA